MDWIVASGRDQTKIDLLLKMLPDSFVDLELQIDRVDQENDRIIQRGGLRLGSGWLMATVVSRSRSSSSRRMAHRSF